MLFRNSIRLLMENFKNVYKILLYKCIVSLVSGALFAAMILPELMEIVNSAEMQALTSDLSALFKSFFAANAENLEAAKASIFGVEGTLNGLIRLVLSKMTAIVLTAVGCVVVYLLKRFAETLCYFAVGSTLNDKMSAYAETPFSAAYVPNLGKASRYALAYVPAVFLIDSITIGAVLFLLTKLNIFPALFLSVTLVVMMQASKLTFTGLWMPSMTADGKPLKRSFTYDKTERRQLPKIFSTYVVTVYAVIALNVIAAVCTFGSALLITVPASYFLFICVQYVNYYTIKGKKYFITYDRIASNPDRGDREHFFDYIDETAPVAGEGGQAEETAKTENE